MKKLKYILCILILGIYSCEDFLNVQPKHNQTIENTVTDYSGAKYIINGMYASGASAFQGGLMCALSSQAGILKGGGSSTNYQMSYTTSSFDSYWSGWFGCVSSANAAIIAISNLADNKFPSVEEKQRMLAEAKCFRAWTYAHFMWHFCHFWKDDEYGVLWREELGSVANMNSPRISVRESYEKIFADLDEAIAHLGDYTKATRLSKQMAQVLKAKLLLNRGWEGDYAAALTLTEEVMSKAPSTFAMNPDMKQMFKDAWDSNEVLWARYIEEGGRAYDEFSYSQSIIQGGYKFEHDTIVPSSLNSFYPEFNNWIAADPRYDATMGWARAISATGILYFCPSKLAREGRIDMEDKWTTYYFRYPELYLMQAELRARTGKSLAEAIAPINTMRSKRTNPVLPQLAVPASQEAFMEILFKEYCLELYAENGSDWLASRRILKNGEPWFKAMKPDVDSDQFDENFWCWPIPATEITLNTAMIQNPGNFNE